MHAGFPCFTQNMNTVLTLGAEKGKVDGLIDHFVGTLVARGAAIILEVGFCFVMRYSLFDRTRARKAEEFFRENFEIIDPDAPNGTRYYQGTFLIRTDKPEDDMNVYLRFCPDPAKLFMDGFRGRFLQALYGTKLNPDAVVKARVLKEKEAEEFAADPDQVDIVISFKDTKTIVGLIGQQDPDLGNLLLENVVRMKGNVGHLMKLGAIGANIRIALG